MANENIEIYQPNFCRGPQSGTICTIDMTNPQTVLKVKNMTGATIMTLTLSSNILTENVRLEYVGPNNLTAIIDGLTFFTFEKVDDTSCMIKRWETRLSYMELLLKEQVTKRNTGDYKYNAVDFAVEYYHRTFTQPNEAYNYLHIDSSTHIQNGTKIFLGPSTDPSNTGATETAVVSSVATDIDGYKLNLTSTLNYEYSIGDPIIFYSYVYIISEDGYAGDPNKGTMYKLDAYDWSVLSIDTKAFYKRLTAAKWFPSATAVAAVVNTNMFFIRPYDSYLNWKSMFMNNVEADENTSFPVYDMIFDGYGIYRLQKKMSLRNGSGGRSLTTWSLYNYQQDTILPYSNSLAIFQDQSIVTGYSKEIDIEAQVRDQFHVGLRDVTVNFSFDGDENGALDPINGQVVTDIDGKVSLSYTSGFDYSGVTNITAQADGSSSYTGSEYIWGENNVISIVDITDQTTGIVHIGDLESELSFKQIGMEFKIMIPGSDEWIYPEYSLFCKTFFTYPGGYWGSSEGTGGGMWEGPDAVEIWLPMLYLGADQQVDSPRAGEGYGFTDSLGEHSFDILTQVADFDSNIYVKSLAEFLVYSEGLGAYVPFATIIQPEETNYLQISQLKLSLHTYYVDGAPYDELWTHVELDQFVFVEEAVPSFWSEKNPVDTDIWIRLRPFAFDLDSTTLKMYLREVSYLGDTGYYEVNDYITISSFDAGSGLAGLEVTCDPPENFLHGSRIFVKIEVYDTATTPNYMYTEYWFDVVPDYKSPYLTNLLPGREDENIGINTTVYFEVKDDGSGLDVDTLECFLNSRRMHPDDLSIEVVSRFHIKVTYTPPEPLYYDKQYKVVVKIQDISEQQNRMNDAYKFYTVPSAGISMIDPSPGPCKRGMSRFEDVSVKVLADGNGIDVGTIRMQVFNKDVHPRILPVIYRIS